MNLDAEIARIADATAASLGDDPAVWRHHLWRLMQGGEATTMFCCEEDAKRFMANLTRAFHAVGKTHLTYELTRQRVNDEAYANRVLAELYHSTRAR